MRTTYSFVARSVASIQTADREDAIPPEVWPGEETLKPGASLVYAVAYPAARRDFRPTDIG